MTSGSETPGERVPSPAEGGGPLVYVEDLDAPVLAAADRHHLERVLRCRPGDPVTVSDGRGRWRPARLGAQVEPAGSIRHEPEPRRRVAVGLALVKGERPEWAVEKLTEIGADEIVLFGARRSVVRWDETRSARHLARLRAVARSAGAQSRRSRLPDVSVVADLDAVVAGRGAAVARAQRGAPVLSSGTAMVAVGPEGGWDPVEEALVPGVVGLGPNVLRTETAAVVAGVLLAASSGR